MSKKKNKKHTSKTNGKPQQNDRVRLGDLNAEEYSQELSPELAEAIDAAFDEGIAAEVNAATIGKTSSALNGALSQQQWAKHSPLKTLFAWGGSMGIAILLMTLLMIVLGWATFVENEYGTNVSRFAIYRAWWFDVLLTLLGVNVLCSMLARLPWRWGHIPFVAAHVGVLILLIGCLVTSWYGIESQLTVYEGELGRFAQKMSGDEIGLEIINFHKTPDDKTLKDAAIDEPEESVHERIARERIATRRDTTKIKPVDRLLKSEIAILEGNERLRVPVTLGPINWREYESKNWFDGKSPVFLGIYAPTEWVYMPLRAAHRSTGIVHEQNGVHVELLDYMADARMKPAKQLKLRVNSVEPSSKSDDDTAATNWTTHELPLGLASDDMRPSDPYLASLPSERISYRLARSNAETEAFLEMAKQNAAGAWGNVVLRFGGQTYVFAVDDLLNQQTQFRMSIDMAQNRLRAFEIEAMELRLQLLDPDEGVDIEALKKQIADKEAEISEQKTELAKLNSQIRMPIGETGLSLEMTTFRPDYLQMILVVSREDEKSHVAALAADQPLASMMPDQLGIQAMHIFDPHEAAKQSGYENSPGLAKAKMPRLDLLQGRDQKLYYRFWDGRKYAKSGELPTDDSKLSLAGDDGSTLNVAVAEYEPHDYPGLTLVAEPLKPGKTGQNMRSVPYVKVRVRVDGIGDETYWLQKTPQLFASEALQQHQIGYVSGKNRTVAATFPAAWFDLGFSLYLHKFERKLEPGINMPLYYSSLVSVYGIDDKTSDTAIDLAERKPLHDRVLIRMNQPGMFTDQTTGRKYRVFQSSYQEPQHPGMDNYEASMGGYLIGNETQPRESLYASVLTANYDPGRGLKYLGSLLIVLGSLALFYTKKVRRKIGLTSLESMATDMSTNSDHDTKSEIQQPRKRTRFGHAMFGVMILCALGATAPQTTDDEIAAKKETVVEETLVPQMPQPFDASKMRVSTQSLDWRTWEELPVFYDGRVMPLATFARITVTNICGRNNPTLDVNESVLQEAIDEKLLTEREAKRIRAKFANGPRQFRNAELVFSWLVEPEVWEYIPYFAVDNQDLRTELHVAKDVSKYVSPYQVKKYAVNVQRIIDQWRKIEAERLDDAEIKKLGEDGIKSLRKTGPKAVALYDRYSAYRMLINEANALPAFQLYNMLAQADRQAQIAYRMQLTLERLPIDYDKLELTIPFSGRNELGLLQQDIDKTLNMLRLAMRENVESPVTSGELEAAFEKLIASFDRLLPEAERFRDAMFALNPRDVPQNTGLRDNMIPMLRNQSMLLAYSMLQSRQWCEAAYLAIYDCGSRQHRPATLQIFPALIAESVKKDRSYPMLSYDREYSETNRMPTWLTLHTFLFGSDAMIRRFAVPGLPEKSVDETNATDEISQENRVPEYDGTMITLIGRVVKEGNPQRVIRSSFREMAVAYLALENAGLYKVNRSEQIERFNRASLAFANNLRANAETTVDFRRELVPTESRDDELLAKTAYPTRKLMQAEYNYERMQPFLLMVFGSAMALMLLLTSVLVSLFDRNKRKIEAVFFWAGFAALIFSEVATLIGACYRVYITGWAPVTNMFETIVLAAFSVVVIGIWYAFQPLFGERLLRAWQVAALPKSLSTDDISRFGNVSQSDKQRFAKMQLIAFLPRLALSIATLYYVILLSYGGTGNGRLSLQAIQTALTMSDPIDLIVVAISLAILTWLVPRAMLAIVLFFFVGKTKSPIMQNIAPNNNATGIPWHHVLLNRKLFLIVGAALALGAGLAAYFGNATFSPNIRPLVAVLRSNFWLTVHVFTIIIGYASGAIAWLLAIIASAVCIFGRWRTTQRPDGRFVPQIPDRAESLMPYIISMLRWTMLLVAVGTILGARWADYSWGRFWSWDPKEVWALVTLLFYLVVLHGRAARYYGNFGVILGTLFGAVAIIMTWYGANVIFKNSRHAYGGTDTDFEKIILYTFIAVHLAWGLLAMMRYIIQKASADAQTHINTK